VAKKRKEGGETMKHKCKFCGKPAPSNMQGYCQVCYRYFIMEDKDVYDLPKYGEITYAPNGDCICPFCGKAFRKLGLHFYYSHHMTSKQAHEKAGWAHNAKATNESYRDLMREKLQEKCVTVNLIDKGQSTRFVPGSPGRTRDKVSAMTLSRLKQNRFKGRR